MNHKKKKKYIKKPKKLNNLVKCKYLFLKVVKINYKIVWFNYFFFIKNLSNLYLNNFKKKIICTIYLKFIKKL